MAAGDFFVDRTNKNVCFDCVQYTHTARVTILRHHEKRFAQQNS